MTDEDPTGEKTKAGMASFVRDAKWIEKHFYSIVLGLIAILAIAISTVIALRR